MDLASTDLLYEDGSAAEAAVLCETLPEETVVPSGPLSEEPYTVPDDLSEEPILKERDITSDPNGPVNIPQEPPVAYPPGNEFFCGNIPVEARSHGYAYGNTPASAYGQPMNRGAFDPYSNEPNPAYGQPVNRNTTNPYSPDYYRVNGYGAPYVLRSPVRIPTRKNNKPVTALVLGCVAMALLNFVPFISLALGIIAVCIGFSGLKQGELTNGKRVCGIIGLVLGMISLILSVTMLTMLLILSVRAFNALGGFGDSILR